MNRHRLKLIVDIVLLVTGLLTFGSGLILLSCFHVGEAELSDSAFGVTRDTWSDLHELPGFLMVAFLAIHLALNWKSLGSRLGRVFSLKRASKDSVELVLYAAFSIVAVTGLVFMHNGPPETAEAAHYGHHIVDIHNVSGVLALLLVAHHVFRRWHQMAQGRRPISQACCKTDVDEQKSSH